jgi:hypothetical protein
MNEMIRLVHRWGQDNPIKSLKRTLEKGIRREGKSLVM